MHIAITDQGHLIVAGMTFYGDPCGQEEGWSESNEISKLWSRFKGLELEIWAPIAEAGYRCQTPPSLSAVSARMTTEPPAI